ncbi:MAG: GIY-YIG nuclease family protein [Candidatus Kerfeldbacteria bacterium]|nr:GIY-YIG nuclease family protein [Candidatus Kerfeldbacteria bacterium]
MAAWYYVYILRSKKDGNLYVGRTMCLARRFQQHQRGENISTAKRLPLQILYFEGHRSPLDAARRERYLKSTKGHRMLRRVIRDTLQKSMPG